MYHSLIQDKVQESFECLETRSLILNNTLHTTWGWKTTATFLGCGNGGRGGSYNSSSDDDFSKLKNHQNIANMNLQIF